MNSAIGKLTWTGLHGQRAELSVRGYELADEGEGYDANWLVLEADFQNELGQWSRASSCLLTWELPWLRRWMRAVVDGEAQDSDLSFLEPDLKLHHLGLVKDERCFALLADFGLAFSVKPGGRDAALVVVRLSSTILVQSLTTIDRWIEAYPPRGKTGRDSSTLFAGPQLVDDRWRGKN